MTRRNTGSRARRLSRAAILGVFAATVVAAAGCERALQVAPTSSVLMLTAPGSAIGLNGTLTITATLTDSSGAPVADGTLVTFSSNLGTFNPIEARVGNGRATTTLVAGATSGIATIRAASGGVTSNSLTVRIGSVPERIVLSATPFGGNSATIVATVFDTAGKAVAGAPVTFSTSSGTLASSVVMTDGLGQATNTLFGTFDAVVTAESSGMRASVVVRSNAGTFLSVNLGLAPANPVRFQNVVFTATTTTPGNVTVFIQRYEWQFSDGVVVTTTGNQTARAFQTEGVFSVIVRVYTLDGAVGISRAEFFVD